MLKRKESMNCFFCGRTCEPVYWGTRIKIGLCDEHLAAYKQHAPAEVNEGFPISVLKALIKVCEKYNECGDH